MATAPMPERRAREFLWVVTLCRRMGSRRKTSSAKITPANTR